MEPITTSLVALGAVLLVGAFVAHCVQRRSKDNETAEDIERLKKRTRKLENFRFQHKCRHGDVKYAGPHEVVLVNMDLEPKMPARVCEKIHLEYVTLQGDELHYPGPVKVCQICGAMESLTDAEYREQYARQMAEEAARLAEEAEELLTTGGE